MYPKQILECFAYYVEKFLGIQHNRVCGDMSLYGELAEIAETSPGILDGLRS